jgi:hypothetical protein
MKTTRVFQNKASSCEKFAVKRAFSCNFKNAIGQFDTAIHICVIQNVEKNKFPCCVFY